MHRDADGVVDMEIGTAGPFILRDGGVRSVRRATRAIRPRRATRAIRRARRSHAVAAGESWIDANEFFFSCAQLSIRIQ